MTVQTETERWCECGKTKLSQYNASTLCYPCQDALRLKGLDVDTSKRYVHKLPRWKRKKP